MSLIVAVFEKRRSAFNNVNKLLKLSEMCVFYTTTVNVSHSLTCYLFGSDQIM